MTTCRTVFKGFIFVNAVVCCSNAQRHSWACSLIQSLVYYKVAEVIRYSRLFVSADIDCVVWEITLCACKIFVDESSCSAFFPVILTIDIYNYWYICIEKSPAPDLTRCRRFIFIPIFFVSSLYLYKNSFDHCKISHSRCIC